MRTPDMKELDKRKKEFSQAQALAGKK